MSNILTETHRGKEVKSIEAYIDKKTKTSQSKKVDETNQYRVLFTDGSYLMIQACGCCSSPWLDENADLALQSEYNKWVEA